MTHSPAFQFYAAEFLSDEKQMVMDLAEVGAYIRLIAVCWREGSIPVDLRKLARCCGASRIEMETVWPAIAPCFSPHDSDPQRLIHPRLEKERQKQLVWREKSRVGGKKSAELRARVVEESGKGGSTGPVEPNGNSSSSVFSLQSSVESKTTSTARQKKSLAWRICPNDWTPTEQHTKLAAQLGIDLPSQEARFREHEFRDPKTDADRAFSRWLRTASEMGHRNGKADHLKVVRNAYRPGFES